MLRYEQNDQQCYAFKQLMQDSVGLFLTSPRTVDMYISHNENEIRLRIVYSDKIQKQAVQF